MHRPAPQRFNNGRPNVLASRSQAPHQHPWLILREPKVPFVDEASAEAQTGGRRRLSEDDAAGQLGHEAKAAITGRTQVSSDSGR